MRFVAALLLTGCASVGPLPTSGPFAIKSDHLGPEDRIRVAKVLEAPSAMVELPLTRVGCTGEQYVFLLDYLPFTAGVLRARKEAVYEVWREPFDAAQGKPGEGSDWIFDDRTGVVLRVRNLWMERGLRGYYTYGSYDLGLFKVWGRSIIFVVYEERDGVVWTQARVYVKVEGLVLERGAKFLGMLERAIQKRAFLFIEVATRVAELAAADPRKLIESVEGSKEVDPADLDEFRHEFVK